MKLSDLFKFREGRHSDSIKPFLDHLEELRWVIIKMGVALFFSMILAFCFRVQIAHIMQWPLIRMDPKLMQKLVSLGVVDSMTVSLQLSFYAGIVISFPFLIYFAGHFIFPALTEKEKKAILPTSLTGASLFILGILFAYFFVLPPALHFFLNDAKNMNWVPTWNVRQYFSFVTQACVGFGIAFELPVVVLLLIRLNILSVAQLRNARAYAFVLIFIMAAFLAPTPDVFAMVLMGAPMYILFEICLIIGSFIEKKQNASLSQPHQTDQQ